MSAKGGKQDRGSDRPRGVRGRSLGFWTVASIVVLAVIYVAILEASRPHVSGERLRLDGFYSSVRDDRVIEATILDQDHFVVGRYRRQVGGPVYRFHAPYSRTSNNAQETLIEALVNNNVPTRVDQQLLKRIAGPATTLLPALIIVIVFVYFLLTMRSGGGMFGRTRESSRVDEPNVTFDDVAGQETAVTELREISDFLANSERYAELGAQIPRGILLYGPPGCGKTLMARALAGEAGAAFYSISGSDFVEMYVGVGARRVRDLFKDAREDAPAIVFIDELDSVGRRRAGGGPGAQGAAEEQGQALNQLLAEIDGFTPAEGVIVVGATNRPDVLDPALLRPGRFDRAVGLELPDEAGRAAVLAVHARGKPLEPNVDLASIAQRTAGMTGADLAGLFNEAALLTARARRSAIMPEDLESALARVRDAPERQRRLSMRDRRMGRSFLHGERVTFADVAGLDNVVDELKEVREFLADRAKFERLGARVPTGYLLAGPPGTGKTLLAHALAGESNAAFIAVAATEFNETYVGEGAARVRDLFAQARGVAPAIVFIDELDSIGGARGGREGDGGERANTLNQLLVELDAFGRDSPVVVMGATNRPEMLDPALTRPGRFDRKIVLEMPDLEARKEILRLHAAERRLDGGVDLDAIARITFGLAGADLGNLLNEAALIAARKGADTITQAHIEDALDRTGIGIASARPLSDEDRRVVAYHEAGHGVVARALPGGRILHRISIVARGNAAGVTWIPETGDRRLHSRSLLIERMATLLGGRVAEQIVFGEGSDGAGNDLARVGEIARRMITVFGMSEAVGSLGYGDERHGYDASQYSDDTARLIDAEARRLVNEAEALAQRILSEQRMTLERIAEALLERETLTMDDIDRIAGPLPMSRA